VRSDELLLADIGNSRIHIYHNQKVRHLLPDDAIVDYGKEEIFYISVNQELEKRLQQETSWKNISGQIHLPNEYDTMGIDRKALCLSYESGVFVDAGSAITVDVMERGIYKGGYIFPGLKAMLESYKRISSALDVPLVEHVDVTQLPLTTKEQISYGIIASIKTLIEKTSDKKRLYFTGGDGKYLAGFFRDGIYDETLVFKGMQHALKASKQMNN